MRIQIKTEYATTNRYLVRVIADGRWRETLPATRGTVIRVRNQACERYAEHAAEVEANAIPDATDMRVTR